MPFARLRRTMWWWCAKILEKCSSPLLLRLRFTDSSLWDGVYICVGCVSPYAQHDYDERAISLSLKCRERERERTVLFVFFITANRDCVASNRLVFRSLILYFDAKTIPNRSTLFLSEGTKHKMSNWNESTGERTKLLFDFLMIFLYLIFNDSLSIENMFKAEFRWTNTVWLYFVSFIAWWSRGFFISFWFFIAIALSAVGFDSNIFLFSLKLNHKSAFWLIELRTPCPFIWWE